MFQAPVSFLLIAVLVCLSDTEARAVTPSATVTGDITCDNELHFYVDGVEQPTGANYGNWEKSDAFTFPANAQVYGIYCKDFHVVASIGASFSNGVITNSSWKCTNKFEKSWASVGFNDAHWPNAHEIGSYGMSPWYTKPKLSASTKWIWTTGWQGQDKNVYCRKVVRQPPVHGGWSAWSDWTSCSGLCENSTQTRSRSCNNPAPSNGGSYCQGSSQESKWCPPCPVDGGWSAWSEWTSCRGLCENSTQTKSRSCTNPAPSNGGDPCQGSSQESQQCPPCPVDGGWSAWSEWTSCSGSCENATQTRSRSCDNPTPSNGGEYCLGDSQESRLCESCSIEPSECSKCNLTDGVGYLPDLCDCSSYYQCQPLGDGWQMHHRDCPRCTQWSQEILACERIAGCVGTGDSSSSSDVQVLGDQCTIGDQTYGVVPGQPNKYKWFTQSGVVIMTCAAPTVFVLESCACGHADDDASHQVTDPPQLPATCLTFDEKDANNSWGFSLSSGQYVGKTGNVLVRPNGVVGKCGYFDQGYLQIYAFSNAFSSYGAFSVSLWYMNTGGSAYQGLVNNGDCSNVGSVHVGVSGMESVKADVRTVTNQQAYVTQQAQAGSWNHVVVTYDLVHLTVYVNGVASTSNSASGQLANSYCPMMIGIEQASNSYFTGFMDEICIYRAALTAPQVMDLYNDAEFPGQTGARSLI